MIGEAPSLRAGVVAVTDVEMENLMTVGDGVVVAIGIVIEIEGKELHFHACMDKSQVPERNILHQIYKEVQISYQSSLFQVTFLWHYV